MEIRNYKAEDANEIIKWISNERDFRLWSADRYEKYPISPIDINNNYQKCIKDGNFYPLTLEDNGEIIGHLILRNSGELDVIRLGFIIVNNKIRGKGYGKKLILEAIKYATLNLHAKEINLGVFDSNTNALNCYKSVGFYEVEIIKNAYTFYDEKWNQVEMVLKKTK